MTTGAIQGYLVGLSRNRFLLACTSLFTDISTEMFYPILPVFLTQTLKASGSIVGLIDGFAEATQNIVQGFAGTLSDKLQRRKPIALVGYFLAAIGKPLTGLATVWQVVFAGRLLDRFGAGTRSAPRDALIASSVSGITTSSASPAFLCTYDPESDRACHPDAGSDPGIDPNQISIDNRRAAEPSGSRRVWK